MPENKDDIDLKGWTLHRAAEENRVDIARALIERGDDVNAYQDRPYSSSTPLHDAVNGDSPDVARLLIKHGADIEARDVDGDTPLYLALRGGNMMELLLEYGAQDPDGVWD